VPRLRQVAEDEIRDPGLASVIERAAQTQSPPPSWYRTMGHNPDVAAAFAAYWDLLHRGGLVEHRIKELCRVQIAQIVGCEFCAAQTSPPAGISEQERLSCALPDWDHDDARTRAALHYARTLTLDDGRDDEVYQELRGCYDDAEIVELAAFCMLTMGGNRMAKSWGIEPHGQTSNIPAGAMSIPGSAGSRR
jgi:alkylhydroperoxidase family enzyme